MANKIFIKCNEATTICDKTQYKEASFLDKIKLSIHNFLCKKCKLYSKQNTFITKLFTINFTKQERKKLCSSDKEALEKSLKEKLK